MISDRKKTVDKNINAWDNIVNVLDNYEYENKSIKYNINRLKDLNSENRSTDVFVVNENKFKCAELLASKNVEPLIVNSICINNPLDYLTKGAINSQIDIFRKTNVWGLINKEETAFPIQDGDVLYAPSLTVIKNENHKNLKNSFNASALFVPFINSPYTHIENNETKYKDDDYIFIEKSVKSIFKIAESYNYNTVVVDDFGCSHGNVPQIIVELFMKYVKKCSVKYLIFCIEDKNIANKFFTIVKNSE